MFTRNERNRSSTFRSLAVGRGNNAVGVCAPLLKPNDMKEKAVEQKKDYPKE